MARCEPRICQMSCAILAMNEGFVIVSTMILVARDMRSHVRAEEIGWLWGVLRNVPSGGLAFRVYGRFYLQIPAI